MQFDPTVCGLFAGIGGLEVGLARQGLSTRLACEIDPAAASVLRQRLGVQVAPDIEQLEQLPPVGVVTAGFPCQDLSMAGPKIGITGARSGLVNRLLTLLAEARPTPDWLVVENVPYMLHLGRGEAMRLLTAALSELGWAWAYRVVDARAFGIPQRRLRVILVASKQHDPRAVLFADAVEEQVDDRVGPVTPDRGYGFYWTEGRRGLGWVVDGVPTIKGGSSLGIPSPPAVWLPDTGGIGTPDIRDLERLQGFDADWTAPAERLPKGHRLRWRLVGNAVCVPVAEWVGRRLTDPGTPSSACRPYRGGRWPRAAWGANGQRFEVETTRWPEARPFTPIRDFLRYPLKPLSLRATRGYLGRLRAAAAEGRFRMADGFYDAVQMHLRTMEAKAAA